MKKICLLLGLLICCIEAKTQIISTLAGAGGSNAYLDGPASIARFSSPTSIATHTNGDVYVADPINNKIRKISGGNVTTFCGTGVAGNTDGNNSLATLDHPKYITIDQYGNLYVSAHDRIRQIDPSGNVTTIVTPTTIASVLFQNGRLGEIAFDKTNTFLYAADSSGRFIRVAGANVTNFTNVFGIAKSMAVDPLNGGFYYISSDNNVYKVLSSGVHNFFLNSHGGNAIDITTDSGNNLKIYIAGDTASTQTINIYTSGGFLIQGKSMLVKNNGDVNGVASGAACDFVSDICIDPITKTVYVSDFNNNKIKTINSIGTPTSSLNYLVPSTNYDICPNTNFSVSPNANATHYNWVLNGTALTSNLNISVNSNSLTINPILAANSGTYTLHYGNTYQNMQSDFVVVTRTVAACSVSTSSNTICLGQSVDLYGCSGLFPINDYQWINSTGVIANNHYAFDSPSTTTTYTLNATDGDCVYELATITVTVNNCSVNVDELFQDSKFEVYPNPASDMLTLKLPDSFDVTNDAKIELINTLGKRIYTHELKMQTTFIDIKNLEKGVYFIRIWQGSSIMNRRFIKDN